MQIDGVPDGDRDPKDHTDPKPTAGFLDLRLVGGRFERRGFPLNGLAELERLEDLIEVVAKALWKRANPDRSRVPKYFSSTFDLRLTEIRPGSVIPIVKRTEVPEDVLSIDAEDYFDLSMAAVEDAFESIVNRMRLPEGFPEEAASIMARFGSSFREDEVAIFRNSTDHPVAYSSSIRKEYFSAVRKNLLVEETARIGRISALDVDEQTFTFAPLNSGKVPGLYQDPRLWAELHEVLKQASDQCWVRLQGTYRIRPDSSIHSVTDVSSLEVFEVPDTDWGWRLLELADLEDEWIEDGEQISTVSLECARDVLAYLAHADVFPGIFPTPSGGVQLEWSAGQERYVISMTSDVQLETRHSNRTTRVREIKSPENIHQLKKVLGGWGL